MFAPALQRSLRLRDAAALVVGCVIGVGIFRAAAPIAGQLQTPGLIMLVWLLGGGISFCGALCFAELGAAYPKAGGDYVYLTRAFGPMVGFLFGWTKLFVERIGTNAALAFVFAEYLGFFIPYGLYGARLTAILAISLLTLANVVSLHVGKQLQNLLTLVKVLALIGIVAVGWWFRAAAGALSDSPAWPATMDFGTLQALGVALVFVIWTYGGWNEVTYVAEEVRDPQRTLPWSILGGLALITALYLAINWVYLTFIPIQEMPSKPLVAAEVMQIIFGPPGGVLTSLIVACSAFGALNGEILTGGRILLAIGRDHPLFSRLAHIHPGTSTPALALIFNALGAILLVLVGTFEQIVTYSTVVLSIFFAMTALAVPILRRRDPQTARPYRVWGYPVTPALFVAAMILLVLNIVWMQPQEALFGFGLLLLGFPLYGLSQTLRRQGT